MYNVVLEVDDNVEPLDDAVFDKVSAPATVADQEDGVIEGARLKQRGKRCPKNAIKIGKLDRVDDGETISFTSGNPTVEVTQGILHLYRSGAAQAVAGQELPDERSLLVCILGVPNTLELPDLLRYLAPVQDGLLHVRIISATAPNAYMVLLRFATQACADEFYRGYHGKPFSALEPELCHAVFVSRVEAANTRGLDVKLKYGVTELPPCAVCLERMDESVTGIVTTLCNHSFHCTCLKAWQDTSCPVCRHTSKPEAANECTVCGTPDGLWICLVCGFIGCGRYLDRHSYQHFVETQHTYAMDLQSRRVWDYVGDNYVHRLIQSTADGKPVELPGASGSSAAEEKVDALTLEYTYLLTSQLESQRRFYTEQLAQCDADHKAQVSSLERRLRSVEAEHRRCATLQQRLDQATKALADEQAISATLSSAARTWEQRAADAEAARVREVAELTDQVRDLMFSIEARERIGHAPELQDASIIVPQQPAAPTTTTTTTLNRRRLSGGRRK